MDFIKIKNLYFSKNTVKKMHSQAIDKEKIFTVYISDEELESCNSIIKPQINWLASGQMMPQTHYRDIHTAEKHMKKCYQKNGGDWNVQPLWERFCQILITSTYTYPVIQQFHH